MIPVCVVFLYLVFGLLYLIYVGVSCLVSCFVFPMPSCVSCPLSLSCGLPYGSLCLLSCSLLVCSSVLLPLTITPGFLPPLSPHLFLIMSLVSVYLVCVFPLTPCLVIVCLCLSMLLSPVWYVLVFSFPCLS